MHREIRVLFVCTSMTGGGAERVVVHLLRKLDRRRFRPELALFSRSGELLSEIPDDVMTHSLEGLAPAGRVRSLRQRLVGLIRDSSVDVVLCHMAETNRAVSRALVGAGSVPVILAEHGVPGRTISEKGGWLRRFAYRVETGYLYRRASAIAAVSEGVRREICTTYRVAPDRVRIIRNGVAQSPLLNTSVAVRHIVAAGRMVPVKGFDVLIRAFALVRQSVTCQLTIYGDGPMKRDLQALSCKLGVDRDTRFPGFVKEFWGQVGDGAAFALSSRSEAFPLVLIEAMQRGVPVISTRCPYGPGEIITDGENGSLVPVDDHEAMAKAMLRLLTDADYAQRLASRARESAARYSVEAMVSEYEELIASLASA